MTRAIAMATRISPTPAPVMRHVSLPRCLTPGKAGRNGTVRAPLSAFAEGSGERQFQRRFPCSSARHVAQPTVEPAAQPLTRKADSGFTLIESLVALAVLAISAIALLGATEAHVARIGGLQQRAAAGWAAENHLVELSLGLSPAAEPDPLLGYPVRLTTTLSATTDPDLARLDITAHIGSSPAPVTRLTGFVFTPPQPGGATP